MTIIIIGEISNDVLKLKHFFKRIDFHDIHTFSTVEAVINFDHLFEKDQVKGIVYDAKLTLLNCEKHCQQIDLLKEWHDAPIFLSTSYEKPVIIERLLEAGIFDVLLKPYDFIKFKTRVQIAMNYYTEAKLRQQHEMTLHHDLELAKKIQKSALPPPLMLPTINCHGAYAPSQSLSGDMYYWFQLDDDLIAFILLDAMGHGIAASLVSMSIRSLLKDIITSLIEPVAVIQEINAKVYDLFSNNDIDSSLVTAIYGLIDTKKQTLQYVNAAHPEGVLFGQDKETITLQSNTPILGLFPFIPVEADQISLKDWQRMILYTDGLLELQNRDEIDLNFFYDYASHSNRYALLKFTERFDLFTSKLKDDVTILSITITL